MISHVEDREHVLGGVRRAVDDDVVEHLRRNVDDARDQVRTDRSCLLGSLWGSKHVGSG